MISDAGFLAGTIFFFFELCGRFHRHAPRDDKVKALSPHHRLVIALHSPDGVGETGLRVRPAEKNTAKLGYGAKQDTFSGPVSGRESQNCADFQRFLGECSLVSLQPRLHGGGRSLALTSLRENSLLTGKNTGNSPSSKAIDALIIAASSSYS